MTKFLQFCGGLWQRGGGLDKGGGLDTVSENESSSAQSHNSSQKPKITMNHMNKDGTMTMFKNRERIKMLPKEKVIPNRPFSISPVRRILWFQR